MKLEELKATLKDKSNIGVLQEMVSQCNGYDGSLEYYYYYGHDKEFYDIFFEDREELARAVWASGNDYDFTDEYIRINVYGNLETINNYDLDELLEDNKDEIIDTYIELLKEDDLDYKWLCNDDEEIIKIFEEIIKIVRNKEK